MKNINNYYLFLFQTYFAKSTLPLYIHISLFIKRDENTMLQHELNRVEDLLSTTRAERDEIGIKYNAISERVSVYIIITFVNVQITESERITIRNYY